MNTAKTVNALSLIPKRVHSIPPAQIQVVIGGRFPKSVPVTANLLRQVFDKWLDTNTSPRGITVSVKLWRESTDEYDEYSSLDYSTPDASSRSENLRQMLKRFLRLGGVDFKQVG